MWPLLWMEWQEILHEVGHPHLAWIRIWHGSASGTERSHAIHGSTDGTPWPAQTRIPCHPWMVHAIRGWHGSASGTEHIRVLDSPKSSGDVEVSDCELAPSCPAFGAAGAQNGLPGPSIPRALRKRTFQKPVHSGYATDEFDDGQ